MKKFFDIVARVLDWLDKIAAARARKRETKRRQKEAEYRQRYSRRRGK